MIGSKRIIATAGMIQIIAIALGIFRGDPGFGQLVGNSFDLAPA